MYNKLYENDLEVAYENLQKKLRTEVNESFDFDENLSNFQCVNTQNSQRFNEKHKQSLIKEIERKREIIYYLKKNLKDQQKFIKKLSMQNSKLHHEPDVVLNN